LGDREGRPGSPNALAVALAVQMPSRSPWQSNHIPSSHSQTLTT